jgi:predicted transcriptional regulator
VTLTEAEYLVEVARQYQLKQAVADAARNHLVDSMRRNYANGMSIVELAKISGFSRPTVMKYVQETTTAPVEA